MSTNENSRTSLNVFVYCTSTTTQVRTCLYQPVCINTRLCTGAVLVKHFAFALWVLQHGTSSTEQTERQRHNNYTLIDCTVTALLAARQWASPSKLLSQINYSR